MGYINKPKLTCDDCSYRYICTERRGICTSFIRKERTEDQREEIP